MEAPDAFDALAEACIANYKAILEHGSSEMQSASRILLYVLAEEIRRREEQQAAPDTDSS